jgi:hypothetical protein
MESALRYKLLLAARLTSAANEASDSCGVLMDAGILTRSEMTPLPLLEVCCCEKSMSGA